MDQINNRHDYEDEIEPIRKKPRSLNKISVKLGANN